VNTARHHIDKVEGRGGGGQLIGSTGQDDRMNSLLMMASVMKSAQTLSVPNQVHKPRHHDLSSKHPTNGA
jgi:hypothetical protein